MVLYRFVADVVELTLGDILLELAQCPSHCIFVNCFIALLLPHFPFDFFLTI